MIEIPLSPTSCAMLLMVAAREVRDLGDAKS
jgi:hypothetical protein